VSPQTAYFATRLKVDARREKLWRYLTDYLVRYMPSDASVLELGAAYCHFINRVPARRKVAVDLSPDMFHWKGPEVETSIGDAVEYLRTAPPEQFDFILASNFFEHFEWPSLKEMLPLLLRVVRHGGRLASFNPISASQPDATSTITRTG
jgi:SAM-dependent methyltransferase